jgi:hypothetical protein
MKIKVTSSPSVKIAIPQDSQLHVATVGIQGPAGSSVSQVSLMADVDVTNLTDGSLLVYEQQSSKWKSTTLLNKQAIDAGEF